MARTGKKATDKEVKHRRGHVLQKLRFYKETLLRHKLPLFRGQLEGTFLMFMVTCRNLSVKRTRKLFLNETTPFFIKDRCTLLTS